MLKSPLFIPSEHIERFQKDTDKATILYISYKFTTYKTMVKTNQPKNTQQT